MGQGRLWPLAPALGLGFWDFDSPFVQGKPAPGISDCIQATHHFLSQQYQESSVGNGTAKTGGSEEHQESSSGG